MGLCNAINTAQINFVLPRVLHTVTGMRLEIITFILVLPYSDFHAHPTSCKCGSNLAVMKPSLNEAICHVLVDWLIIFFLLRICSKRQVRYYDLANHLTQINTWIPQVHF